MFNTIDRNKLKKKIDNKEQFALVEVLDPSEYKKGHLPGAINIPLEEIGKQANEKLNPDDEVVVYCSSFSCGASPAAAKKLEKLGFDNVYDYEGGKKDWLDAGNKLEK